MKRYEGTIITCDSKDRVAKHLVEDRGADRIYRR